MIIAGLDFGDIPAWISVAMASGALFTVLLLVVPPLMVSATVDPAWQVEAQVRCTRPWKRTVTMLKPIYGLPPRFDRWFGRKSVSSRLLEVKATDWSPTTEVEGRFNVKLFLFDLATQAEGTEVAVVVKCGLRSHYCRAERLARPRDHGHRPAR